MRILGLDVGNKRIGMAISDELGLMAQPLFTLKRKGIDKDVDEIKTIILENKVDKIVIGEPKNMDGTNGFQWDKVKYFSDKLSVYLMDSEIEVDISFVDERLTTVSANRIMFENSVKEKKRKELVDTIAAVVILDTFLSMTKKELENG
ncbi:MAG: Holliday junction resolvase RuvX [Filifactoraceae bacterium]